MAKNCRRQQLAGIVAAALVTRAHMRWQAVEPALADLRRELTLLVGYLEVLGSDPQLPPALRRLADSALQAAWRAVQQTSHIRHNGVPLDRVLPALPTMLITLLEHPILRAAISSLRFAVCGGAV